MSTTTNMPRTLTQARATLAPVASVASGLFSVREAAMRAHMNEFTLWKLIRQGKLKAYGRPGALRVSLGDLLAPYDPKGKQ
jgi:hypothetical protein